MRITLTILLLCATIPVFGQGARTLLFDRTNLTVAVPESGFFDSNRVDIGNALKNPAMVDTMDELRARSPRSNEVVGVRNFSASIPYRNVRFFVHDPASSATRDGVHTETNAAAIGRYVSTDRRNAIQFAEWWGIPQDDTGDATDAIQSAINYCYSNNVPVLDFPAGTIRMRSVSFTGTGLIGGLTLQGAPGLRTIIKGITNATMFTIATMRKVDIRNLWFDGNDIATNLLVLDGCTELRIDGNDFYRSAGTGVRLKGSQNYGHLIQFNNFINNHEIGLDVNGGSTTANTVHRNKFEAPGWTNSIGIRVVGASANHDYTANVFQSLRYGIYFDGGVGGQQLQQSVDQNYFEVFTDVPIGLGPNQINGLTVTRNYFFQDYTTGGWCLKDTNSTILYGFKWVDNIITSDSGKALSLTNSAVRNWVVKPGPADIATDYQLPSNVSLVWESQSQRLASFIYTNYDASSSTNYLIAGDFLPNILSIGSTSNIAVNINGFTYTGSELTLRNHGSSNVVFVPANQLIFGGQEEHFFYNGSSWLKSTAPYLPDYVAATMRGNFTINTNLSVGGTSLLNGTVTLGGALLNNYGYLTSGGFGETNVLALGGNSNAIVGVVVNGFYYALFGTNGTTRFESDVVIAPNKGLSLGGTLYTNWPTGSGGMATNAPTIAVDGVSATNVNFADSAELLVTKTDTNVTYALATSGASAGSYTNPTVTVDSKGRVTSIANGTSGSYVYVNGDTANPVTNFVANPDVAPVRTNGTAAFTLTTTNGTGDVLKSIAPVMTNATLLGETALSTLTVDNLNVTTSAVFTNGSFITPKLGAATATSLDVTNSVRMRNLTASRVLVSDASGYVTNDIAETGTGAPVRAVSPALTGTPTAPTASANSSNTTIATTAYADRAVASISGAPGTIAINGSGSYTNIADTDTTAWTGSSGSMYASNRFPQVFIWTNAVVTNWTYPVGTRLFKVYLIGGGGGGGSGRKGLTNTIVGGGGGGGGAAYSFAMIPVEALGTNLSITVTVGTGGSGGSSITNDSTNGNPGNHGTSSSFGSLVIASGGDRGSGGTSSGGNPGGAGATYSTSYGTSGGAASATGLGGSAGTDTFTGQSALQYGAAGGGGGGGITTANASSAGGRGGIASMWATSAKGGTGYSNGGSSGGGSASNAQSAHTALLCGGSGAGGGGSSTAGNGGNGGNGGRYGGGGGGGGAANDGVGNSGAGGNGADGIVMVICE